MSLKDYPSYRKNPFLQSLLIKERVKLDKVGDTDLALVDNEGKKVDAVIVYATETNLDRSPFIKLFNTEFLTELNSAGIIMFHYICQFCLKFDTDTIIIYTEDVLDRTKYKSKSDVYKGIGSLIGAQVIARTPNDGVFWINPAVLYKGERRYLKLK